MLGLKTWIQNLLIQSWASKNLLSWLLLPLSILTYIGVISKRLAHKDNTNRRLPVPVIIVGNIYVGGTGKTPLIIDLANFLKKEGWRPGIISRGYGVLIGEEPHASDDRTDAAYLGDEPALIHRRTGLPVHIHPKRLKAAKRLLKTHPDVNVIISDDGLQHLALARDIEIVVQDQRGIGNGWLLPAGPLREPASRLKSIDILVTNIGHATSTQSIASSQPPFSIEMALATPYAYHMQSSQVLPCTSFKNQQITAVCALGNPQRFFDSLQTHQLKLVQSIVLPDHAVITEAVFDAISTEIILITEKDAVKCIHINDPRIWVVRLDISLSDLTPYYWILKKLHGYKTA